MSTIITEEAPIDVSVFRSPNDGALVVQIDTESDGDRVRVNLNEGVLWDGDPEVDVSNADVLEKIQFALSNCFDRADVGRLVYNIITEWRNSK